MAAQKQTTLYLDHGAILAIGFLRRRACSPCCCCSSSSPACVHMYITAAAAAAALLYYNFQLCCLNVLDCIDDEINMAA